MEEYIRKKKLAQARKMLSLSSVPEEQLVNFDNLCRELDLTVADVTDWEEEVFFHPQEN